MPKCPGCGAKNPDLLYTEDGTKVWDAKKGYYVESEKGQDAEWRCGDCGIKLDYDDLRKLKAF